MRYNLELRAMMLNGEKVKLYPRLANMYIQEKPRKFVLKKGQLISAVDWEATYKLNEKDEIILISPLNRLCFFFFFPSPLVTTIRPHFFVLSGRY